MLGIIRHIGMIQMYRNDTNALGMMQLTRPLELRLRLEVKIHNGLKVCCT